MKRTIIDRQVGWWWRCGVIDAAVPALAQKQTPPEGGPAKAFTRSRARNLHVAQWA